VDVQTTRRETVLSNEVVQSLPATRSYHGLLTNIPGLMPTGGVGAETNAGQINRFTAHGGRQNEGRISVNGLVLSEPSAGAGVSSLAYDVTNVDEVQVLVSGGLGESETGGPVMNLVPRSGGNRFAGSAFYSGAGDWSRSNNVDDELRAIGILEPPAIVNAFDANGSLGGPILRDRLWFFGSVRRFGQATIVSGAYANANAGNAARWDYVPDRSVVTRNASRYDAFSGRLTAQLTPRNRVSFSQENQYRCQGSPLTTEGEGCRARESDWVAVGTATSSPESYPGYHDFPYHVTQGTWSSPVSSRLLLDAGFNRFYYQYAGFGQAPPDALTSLIPVTEQSTIYGLANFNYRGLFDPAAHAFADNQATSIQWRASAAYVTGAHNFKVGYMGADMWQNAGRQAAESALRYTFNRGVPVSFGYVLSPRWDTTNKARTMSLFAQDQWTLGKLTLQGALRYDRAWSYSPGGDENGAPGTSALNLQPITFERTASVDAFNDLTPRFGVAYDVFGNGRTAVKFNMGHYLDAATNDSAYTRNNPANRTVSTLNRGWTDVDNDKVVDCDLLNLNAQGPAQTGANRTVDTCAAITGNDLNFGGLSGTSTRVNPDTLRGWGVRENDWQWGLTVQQELLPRLSIEVGYARRWFRGVTVTDNQARTPDEYNSYTITAPSDPRLPGGGGYPVTVYVATAAAAREAAQNYITFQSDFGPEETNYWHGLDVTLNARTRWGLTFSGGTSTGRSVQDECATAGLIDSPDTRNCRDVDPFQTTFRGLASYTIPKIDVLVSGTIRSQPQVALAANLNLPNTTSSPACAPNPSQCLTVQSLLGRLPTGTVSNGTTTIALLDNDHRLYSGERRTQVDMRFAKILRFGSTRADIGVDVGNLLNTNYATGWEDTYQYSIGNAAQGGSWNNPETVYTPRFVRLNFTVNF
jgi:hypothetical protein